MTKICAWKKCLSVAIPGMDYCDPHQEMVEDGVEPNRKVPRGRPSMNLTIEEKAARYDALLARQREYKRRGMTRAERKAIVKQAGDERRSSRAR